MPRIRAATILEHKSLVRAALLDAAFDLFAARGFAGTRLADVAAAAGLGRTTLYEYFPNKVELFLALIEDRVPPLLDEVMASLPAGIAPGERIERLFSGSFGLLVDQQELARLVFVVGRELPAAARRRMWRVLEAPKRALWRMGRDLVDDPDDREVDYVMRAIADLLVGGIEQALTYRDAATAVPDILATRLRFLRAAREDRGH